MGEDFLELNIPENIPRKRGHGGGGTVGGKQLNKIFGVAGSQNQQSNIQCGYRYFLEQHNVHLANFGTDVIRVLHVSPHISLGSKRSHNRHEQAWPLFIGPGFSVQFNYDPNWCA